MPIYEYECQACGQEFEKLVLNSAQEIDCPKCRSKQVTKQFSMFASPTAGKAMDPGGGSKCGGCTTKSCAGCG